MIATIEDYVKKEYAIVYQDLEDPHVRKNLVLIHVHTTESVKMTENASVITVLKEMIAPYHTVLIIAQVMEFAKTINAYVNSNLKEQIAHLKNAQIIATTMDFAEKEFVIVTKAF
jgi:hypothetical protein